MKYKEIKNDIFGVSSDYAIAYSISADLVPDNEIAIKARNKFGMTSKLMNSVKNDMTLSDRENFGNNLGNSRDSAGCIFVKKDEKCTHNIFALVTKKKANEKPTYKAVGNSLKCMRKLAIRKKIKKIALTPIECGVSGLYWKNVSEMIKNTFENTDIDILVYLGGK